MTPALWLLLITCALSIYNVGQVWLVQLSSYPLWARVGQQEFSAYHAAWWRGIWGVILLPAGLVTLGAILMLWWRAPSVPAWMAWLGLSLQAALILGTAFWWAPLMARLDSTRGERYRLLLTTHWLRVQIVTAYGFVTLWMLARSAWHV
jgi:hypothetical protein